MAIILSKTIKSCIKKVNWAKSHLFNVVHVKMITIQLYRRCITLLIHGQGPPTEIYKRPRNHHSGTNLTTSLAISMKKE